MRVTVVGIGLIGGWFALALKDKGIASKVIGVESNEDHQQKALPLLIEVETRSLEDVALVCAMGKGKVFRIMLDNFSPEKVAEAVRYIDGQFETEASGGINLNTIQSYAATGVDFVSVGGLIHQAQSLDLSLKAVITE